MRVADVRVTLKVVKGKRCGDPSIVRWAHRGVGHGISIGERKNEFMQNR